MLADWTDWSEGCSKACGMGTKKKERWIKEDAEGEGKCADKWHKSRLQYEKCQLRRCSSEESCERQQDVMLMLDTCPTHGGSVLRAMKTTAQRVVQSYQAG